MTRCMMCLLMLSFGSAAITAEGQSNLSRHLLFHASFDESVDADFAKADRKIYTAESLKREKVRPGLHVDAVTLQKEGRFGGSLRFRDKTDAVVFYRGGANVPYASNGFEGTISFWMQLSPDEDLPDGYVDPLQITDKAWNDAAVFVDFTDVDPRQFRLGVFSDLSFWNPAGREWDDIPERERPMITVVEPPFARDRWTHVAVVLSGFNESDSAGQASLYLDGKLQGHLPGKQRFTWQPDEAVILLGLNYVGGIDDLAVFDRALTDEQVQHLFALPNGIASLR